MIARPSRSAHALALVACAAVFIGACSNNPASPRASASPTRAATATSAATAATPPSAAAGQAGDPARSPALRRFYDQRLRWHVCGGPYQCARLKVPLDYGQPSGPGLDISVVRLPAEGPGKRVGSLIVNPGGPGASGIDYARQARTLIPAPVRQRYDIVGFDPRGVGQSSPVECLTDREMDEFTSIDGSPDNWAEKDALMRESRSFAEACARHSAPLLAHIGTPDVARDIDVLRAALGDRRLYFLGKSYGTFIGATYAELFPSRVGRLVLDGAIDPSVSGDQMALAQARGFERSLAGFVDDCLPRPICPLEGSREQALRRIRGLLEQIDRSPLPTGERRRLTQSLATLGIAVTLYEQGEGWPALSVALRQAFNGDGSILLHLADIYTDRTSDGRYRSNQNEAIYAVDCIDHPASTSAMQIEQLLPGFREASPTFGEYLGWSNLPCGFWPVRPVGTAHRITAPGAPPILVVGTTRDPATPYVWAQGLARQLQSGVLLTYVGDGHTAYGRGSACIDTAVDNYLLRGRPPRDGTRCA